MDFTNCVEFYCKKIKILRKQTNGYKNFDRIRKSDYYTFFRNYLMPNKPCIFDPEVTEWWKSRAEWGLDNTPNFAKLRSKFGDANVPVANCKQEQYSSHPKQDMLLSEYLDYWERYRRDGYPADEPCLYLKDWHFTRDFPDFKAYETPVYFQSDWLNEFWDTLPRDDYRFVYMGPKGTWTPFHADVYRSYSWSANICGKKKWIFYPPGCEESLTDNFGNLVYDVTSHELDDKKKFPNAHKVKDKMLEVIQDEGQIIFVPSGWHHQVFNLEDTISINHNWLNGCNIDICWKHLQDSLQDVKKEIENCRDMEGWNAQCQLILRACAGIDYMEFVRMLRVIAENRIEQYREFQKGHTARCARFMTDNNENCSGGARLEKDKSGPALESHTDGESETFCFFQTEGTERKLLTDSATCETIDENRCGECETRAGSSETICEKCEGKDETCEGRCEKCETLELTEQLSTNISMFCYCGVKVDCDKYMYVDLLQGPKWTDQDYLVFDISRIRETLQDIIVDEDYNCIEKDENESAEYVFEMLETLK